MSMLMSSILESSESRVRLPGTDRPTDDSMPARNLNPSVLNCADIPVHAVHTVFIYYRYRKA